MRMTDHHINAPRPQTDPVAPAGNVEPPDRRPVDRIDDTRPISPWTPSRTELDRLLDGEPRYRIDQLWDGLYHQDRTPAEQTNLPKRLRADLDDRLRPALTAVTERVSDGGDTVKWLFATPDGAEVETVLMHYPGRSTVCVSSQAGCAMGCGFCATGQAGYDRNLAVGEILEQVVAARRAATVSEPARRLSNIVFMGMGEPLANYDRVAASLHRIVTDLGIGARHITVSTVGLAPQMHRLADEGLQVGLALSLHAANDDLRSELVPLNRRHPIAELVDACRAYRDRTGRRVSIEWAMIDGVNDRVSDAEELAGVARRASAHVNLIPLNPTPGWPTVGSPPERIRQFRRIVADRGVNVTVRANRGTEIDAACGQLAAAVRSGRAATSSPVELGSRRSAPHQPSQNTGGPRRSES